MALKITGCNWCIDIVNYSMLMLSFLAALVLIYVTDDDPHLANNYSRNWNTKYIVDVKFQTTDCEADYSKVQLGMWSGFNEGCYCKHSITGDIEVYDKACATSFSDAYTCQGISSVNAVNITEYKDRGHFCIKRSTKSFFDIFTEVEKLLKVNGTNKYNNDTEYFNIVLKYFTMDTFDPKAISDIKFVTKDMKNLLAFPGYETITPPDSDFDILIKRFNNGQRFDSVFDLNELVVDIHLYNHLWCAYLDVGAPDEINFQKESEINFSLAYCNKIQKEKSLFFNDGYQRSVKINTNLSPTRSDFYPKTVFESIQKQLSLTKINDNAFEPVLVYEKYYYGLGCKFLKNPSDHISELSTNQTVRKLSIGTIITQMLTQLILIIYIFLKVRDNRKAVSFCIFIIMGLVGVTLFLSFTAMITAKNSYSYFNTYDFWCQNDFKGHRYESNLEVAYKNNLALAGILHLGLMGVQIISGFFLILGFFNNCCCKPKDDSDSKSGLEMKMNSSINRN